MNPNDAEVVRVFTRQGSGGVPDYTPNVTNGSHSFQVVVEAEAGTVLGNSSQPYQLRIEALDITAGDNPGTPFSKTVAQQLSSANGWPQKTEAFTVTLTPAQIAARKDHILKYYAVLLSSNDIISFAESPLFILT
jgi:hypothetical protein